ncbi:hypothetical protein K3G63_19355 [Hymenobacter sp. HSC-4F20]|uniref:hypothetical protein n=1 Tax=Hymenobacter sp. HSC-4F20 TaxID=2864135 RepID=UPI001C72B7B2|nr:hypothetical protein [Hymenobacter sp. HSC-4F20]MBX0292610.1 hypothetical protein [Hymenobacter sp. HSC-4F20]
MEKQPSSFSFSIQNLSSKATVSIYGILFIAIAIGIFKNNLIIIYTATALLIVFFFIRLTKFFPINLISQESTPSRLSFTNTFIEIFALIFAGMYFFYKIFGNLDITDLQLRPEYSRVPIPDSSNDHLAIKINLTKGSTTSMKIEDIKIYVHNTQTSGHYKVVHATGFAKLYTNQYDQRGNLKDSHTAYITDIDKDDKYSLAATETTCFSAYTTVKRDTAYIIQVLVVGQRRKFLHKTYPLFRSSIIALPAGAAVARPGADET